MFYINLISTYIFLQVFRNLYIRKKNFVANFLLRDSPQFTSPPPTHTHSQNPLIIATFFCNAGKYGYIHIYINFRSLESLSPVQFLGSPAHTHTHTHFLLLMINIKLHHTPNKSTLKVHCTNRFIAHYVLKVLLTATSYFI